MCTGEWSKLAMHKICYKTSETYKTKITDCFLWFLNHNLFSKIILKHTYYFYNKKYGFQKKALEKMSFHKLSLRVS